MERPTGRLKEEMYKKRAHNMPSWTKDCSRSPGKPLSRGYEEDMKDEG
jgi:hypothetical protein